MMATAHRPYSDLFGLISQADADAEPDQLFSPAPKMTITTTLEIDGLQLTITINDTSIDEALRLLKRRGDRPAPRPVVRRPRRRRPTQPTYDLVWGDFDDEPSEAGAKVVELAQALRTDHPHWSTALAVASQTIQENLQ